tara:strand:- start:101 stop:1102 length:1002 start_codon:yes stop_codon:yes gene_type:complete
MDSQSAIAIQEFSAAILSRLLHPFLAFNQQDSLLYWPFLVSTMIFIIIIFAIAFRPSVRTFIREFRKAYFTKSVWGHPSSIADYKYYLVNAVLFPIIFSPAIISGGWLGKQIRDGLIIQFGAVERWTGDVMPTLVFTLIFFLLHDLGRWSAHYIQHRFDVLWKFHMTHHSAQVLTPFTNFRAHPIDLICMATVPAILTGIASGIYSYAIGRESAYITYYGLHVLIFAFNLIGNLRHTHVWLSYGSVLSHIFISPAQHQIHHSTEAWHFGHNLGFALAIWDWMFGTLYVPKEKETFDMGLGDGTEPAFHNLKGMYFQPFINLFQSRHTISGFGE